MKLNDQQTPPISATRNEVFSFEQGKWIPFPDWLRAHDAGVRADQAEVDAAMADELLSNGFNFGFTVVHGMVYISRNDAANKVPAAIRRAVALTPTTTDTTAFTPGRVHAPGGDGPITHCGRDRRDDSHGPVYTAQDVKNTTCPECLRVLTPPTEAPTICGALAEAMGGYTTYECKLPPKHEGRHDWVTPTTEETEQ